MFNNFLIFIYVSSLMETFIFGKFRNADFGWSEYSLLFFGMIIILNSGGVFESDSFLLKSEEKVLV